MDERAELHYAASDPQFADEEAALEEERRVFLSDAESALGNAYSAVLKIEELLPEELFSRWSETVDDVYDKVCEEMELR